MVSSVSSMAQTPSVAPWLSAISSAGLRGYGNLVIIKHNNTYLTAYAHNQTLLVKDDQAVRKGQKIAEMGSTDADSVRLHFEIRRQGKPIDPAKLLPPR
jgi:lipoprotein NlpD